MRFWDNKEVPGRGTKFCLVMDPEDGTHPIRTYGWSMEEVLDKVAKTAETAQATITRLRANPAPLPTAPAAGGATQGKAAPAAPPAPKPVTADEQLQATNDLTNPAKAPGAIKTLLRAAGVDVDRQRLREEAEQAAAVAQEWERTHPGFPDDPRNQRLLMDKALLLANGRLGLITAEVLNAAYAELLSYGMLFEPEPEPAAPPTEPAPAAAPEGTPATRVRTTRTATSYRATSLRAAPPVARPTPKYTRAEVAKLNSKQYREKLENEPEFRDFVNREFSSATA